MRARGDSQEILGLQPGESTGHIRTRTPEDSEGSAKLERKSPALNRFVSKATDKCLPFFRVLKKSFEWTDECQKAFEDLKKYFSSPPLLSSSMPGEELYLYIVVSQEAVSAALVRDEGGSQ